MNEGNAWRNEKQESLKKAAPFSSVRSQILEKGKESLRCDKNK